MAQDLSRLARNWSGTGSMSGSNMISDSDTGAPGSTSEATEDVPRRSPALDIPATESYAHTPIEGRLKALTGEDSPEWQHVAGVTRTEPHEFDDVE
jgi:hypothetical protein